MLDGQDFGGSEERSSAGALLGHAVARATALLRGGGLMLARGPDGWIVVIHPGRVYLRRRCCGGTDRRGDLCRLPMGDRGLDMRIGLPQRAAS